MSAKVVLTVVQGEPRGKEFVFRDRTICTIGRACNCYLRIPNDYFHMDVSRHHCVLDIDPPLVRVWDAGSRNGTYVNGEKIGQRAEFETAEEAGLISASQHYLVEGDEVRVGHVTFRVGVVNDYDDTEYLVESPDAERMRAREVSACQACE